MSTFRLSDLGSLRIRAEDPATGAVIESDAGEKEGGLGAHFSPTDLVAVALGQCLLTVLSILARRMKVDIGRPTAEITKVVSERPPIRFQKIAIAVQIPTEPEETVRQKLTEGAEHYCPVLAALHPDIQVETSFHWGS